MSSSTILHIFPGERIECGDELRNSWGTAPYVWDWLIKEYIDETKSFMYREVADKLWKLWKDERLPQHHKAVLMFTYDGVYVAQKDFKRFAQDLRLFLQDHNNAEGVNHWPRIAEIFEGNPDVPGIGLWCTSVSDNPFYSGWDEEKEEYLIDWEKVYDLYESLDAEESDHEN